MLNGEKLAEAVLNAHDRYALLSLGSAIPLEVNKEGYLNLDDDQVRKVYLKLSVRVELIVLNYSFIVLWVSYIRYEYTPTSFHNFLTPLD
jgi:hypothetical protein